MMDDIGGKLAALRKQAGLSQKELAQRLTALGEPVTDKALSKWEKGATLPSARQFLLACQALEVADISGEFMGGGLGKGLDAVGRQKLAEYAELLRCSGLYEPKPERGRAIRLYTLAASAGPGQFLDDGDYQWTDAAGAPRRAGGGGQHGAPVPRRPGGVCEADAHGGGRRGGALLLAGQRLHQDPPGPAPGYKPAQPEPQL